MNPRDRAARELLDRLERAGVVIWCDESTRLFKYRDPHRAFTQPLCDQVNALAREFEYLLRLVGCRDGYARGPTRWHVAVIRRGRREYACGAGVLDQTESTVPKLPPYAPGGELCSRCARQLVDRELTLALAEPNEREPR